MNLSGRTFRALTNSSGGTLNADTRMTFLSQTGQDITGEYSGGTIRTGRVVALRTRDSTLVMLYQWITTTGSSCVTHRGRRNGSITKSSSLICPSRRRRLIPVKCWSP